MKALSLIIGAAVIIIVAIAALTGTLTHPLGAVGFVIAALALLGLSTLVRSGQGKLSRDTGPSIPNNSEKGEMYSPKSHTTSAATGDVHHSGQTTNPTEDRSDYGTLLRPPSTEAIALLSSVTVTEKSWFTSLLEHAQKWHESEMGHTGLIFHPEARTAMWAVALSKIADRYHESNNDERALFFADAAWKLSKYPVFAFNAAVLQMALDNGEAARPLLYSYLAEYKNIHLNSVWQLIDPSITSEQLEEFADSARVRLTAIGL